MTYPWPDPPGGPTPNPGPHPPPPAKANLREESERWASRYLAVISYLKTARQPHRGRFRG